MPVDEPQYPVQLNVAGKRCLVVGGGHVAVRKARGLLAAHADVTMLAPEVVDAPAVNRQVFLDGEAAGIWVNSADDPANCSFTLPAVVRRGPLTITVATAGQSPALTRWLREQLEAEFGPEYEVLLRLLAEARE